MERSDCRGVVRFTRHEAVFIVYFIQGMINKMDATMMSIVV